ncbi:hypothetical protein ACVWWO_007717 [Bradyrhizobium sp. F1.13.1]
MVAAGLAFVKAGCGSLGDLTQGYRKGGMPSTSIKGSSSHRFLEEPYLQYLQITIHADGGFDDAPDSTSRFTHK